MFRDVSILEAIKKLYLKKVDTNEINNWVQDWLSQCSNNIKRDKYVYFS